MGRRGKGERKRVLEGRRGDEMDMLHYFGAGKHEDPQATGGTERREE